MQRGPGQKQAMTLRTFLAEHPPGFWQCRCLTSSYDKRSNHDCIWMHDAPTPGTGVVSGHGDGTFRAFQLRDVVSESLNQSIMSFQGHRVGAVPVNLSSLFREIMFRRYHTINGMLFKKSGMETATCASDRVRSQESTKLSRTICSAEEHRHCILHS